MKKLKFQYERDFQIDPSLTKEVNDDLLKQNERGVTLELEKYIDRLNNCGAYISVTISQDGKKFKNHIRNCEDGLFAEIHDDLNSRVK